MSESSTPAAGGGIRTSVRLPEGMEDAVPFGTAEEREQILKGDQVTSDVAGQLVGNPQPRIAEPPSGDVTLPGGYWAHDGIRYTNAKVRELTGEDEEALASYNWQKNLAEYTTQLLLRGVVSVGPNPMNDEIAKRLYLGDRDFLVLKIRQATFGDDIQVKLHCPVCDVDSDVIFDINDPADIPVKTMKDDNRVFEVELRHGSKAVVVLPTGEVQERCAASKLDDAQINTLMLSMCVKEIDGKQMITQETVRALPLADRRTLLNFVMEEQPGPRFGLMEAPCHRCGRTYPTPLSIGDIFR